MKTKIFTLFLALTICVELLQAFTVIDGINYDFNDADRTAIVSRRASYSGDIVIPDSVRFNYVYYHVTGIYDKAFQNCESLTSITIPNSILSIGEEAFSGCSGLTSVSLGNGITTIEKGTFSDCGLISFTIPNSVVSIGENAFSGCLSLTSIVLPNSVISVGKNAFSSCQNIATPIYNDYCFAYLPTSFKGSYSIPSGIKQITGGACSFCRSLISISIPNSVTSIGDYAFQNCDSLISVNIGNGVINIGDYAFCSCSSLTSLTIPNSVINIGKGTFEMCKNLESVSIGNSVTNMGGAAFKMCTSLSSISIGNSIKSIGDGVFGGCSNLRAITIPNGVLLIGDRAFEQCTTLDSIVIPNSVKSIGANAFERCSNLSFVSIGNSVDSIFSDAFARCTNLASITIPNSVRYIENAAFYGCTGLISVTILGQSTNFADQIWGNCISLSSFYNYAVTPQHDMGSNNFNGIDKNTCKLYVPAESIELYKASRYWKGFKNILPILAAEVSDAVVSATPSVNSVVIEWPEISGADTYTIELKKNEELVRELNFDEQGKLITHHFAAPARNGDIHNVVSAIKTTNGWQYKIEGLDYSTQYSYTITAKESNSTLYTQTITFMTDSYEAIENINGRAHTNNKILRGSQVIIFRNNKTYTITGAEIK